LALLVDAGALYAQADANEPRHASIVKHLKAERGALVTTELVVAEADYLILDRLGIDVELAFVDDLAHGTFTVECLSRAELAKAHSIIERYRDLKLGLADASLVVIAQRYKTTRILTFDDRAFRAVTPLQGGSFTVMPERR
jgi:uncharacterized protein